MMRAFLFALVLTTTVAACATTEKHPLTPWFRQVYWWNNCIIAESGCGRGLYAERKNKDGDFERIGKENESCQVAARGAAVLCGSTIYKPTSAITIDCSSRSLDGNLRAEAGDFGSFATATVDEHGDVICVERYYAPVRRQIERRFDLEGHEVGRRELPLEPPD